MTKGKQYYLDNIIEDAYINVFAANGMALMEYPYIVGNPRASTPTLEGRTSVYVMDSKINDPDVGNERVLRRAEHVGCDVLTPADELHSPDLSTERTVDMFERIADVEYDPGVMIPLHANQDEGTTHLDHYYQMKDALAEIGEDITDHRISIGGVKEWSVMQKLRAIVAVRNEIGHDAHLHGLGFGASKNWVAIIRQYPDLLDSVDMSTVTRDVVSKGELFAPQCERVPFRIPRGKNSTVLSILIREWVLYMVAYLMGPHAREADVPTEIPEQRAEAILEDYDNPTNTD